MAKGKRRATGSTHAPPVTQSLGPARRASRAVERERRRRGRRRRTTMFAVAGAVVLLVLVAFAVNQVVKDDPDPPVAKERTQRTLLLSVTGDSGAARASVLLAYDPTPRQASLVLIPPSTLTDVAGLGNVVLANALRLGGPTSARESVSDLMGVTVDHDWTLTSEGFVALVDRTGGVIVDVDADVVVDRKIVVPAGPAQRLDGASALRYATYVAKGQDQITFQARLQRVLEALLTALPEDQAGLTASLATLGGGSRTSWDAPALAGFLDGVRRAQAEDRYEPQVLPVAPIDAGGGTPVFTIKVDEVTALVSTQLAESIPPGRQVGKNRVLVLNGVGTPGLGRDVAAKVRDTEFAIVGTRNKQGFGEKQTVVVFFENTPENLDKARRLAALLGLPETAVKIGTQAQSVADFVIVVGADFKP